MLPAAGYILRLDFQGFPAAVPGGGLPQVAKLPMEQPGLYQRRQWLWDYQGDNPLPMPLEHFVDRVIDTLGRLGHRLPVWWTNALWLLLPLAVNGRLLSFHLVDQHPLPEAVIEVLHLLEAFEFHI